MDVKQEINQNYLYLSYLNLFLLLPYLKPHKIDLKTNIRVTLMQEVGRHNGLRMNTVFWKAQDVTDITFQHTYGVFLMSKTDLAKFKGLLIKIKVIKGFLAKLKVLKDCNQIKGF